MELFERIPEHLFGILASSNRRLYVSALFVLHDTFQRDLQIRRSSLTAMLINRLEIPISDADFSEDEQEIREKAEDVSNLTGRVHFVIRKLRDTGWLDIEVEKDSFEEIITIPDYSIAIINLLYDIANEKVREYNSYVYTTYSALKNVADAPDYALTALLGAFQNTERLVGELKTLYSNIRRYNARILEKTDVNEILEEHFLNYREKVFDAFYYPLKTMDSVPRFKNSILAILGEWIQDEELLETMVRQGMERHLFSSEAEGSERVLSMINGIMETYDGIELLIARIDERQSEYTQAAAEKIEYLMNVDVSVRGKLVRILSHARSPRVAEAMQEENGLVQSRLLADGSLYSRGPRRSREMTAPKSIGTRTPEGEERAVEKFLNDVRRQFNFSRADAWMAEVLRDREEITTEEMPVEDAASFICFILATIRARQQSAPYRVSFREGDFKNGAGYTLPMVRFTRRKKRKGED